MDKIAQNALFTTEIATNKALKTLWDKHFLNKHTKVIASLRSALQLPNGDKIKAELTKLFPLQGDSWKTFAYEPVDLSMEQIKNVMNQLLSIPDVQNITGANEAINEYLEQYKILSDKLKTKPNQPVKKPAVSEIPKEHAIIQPKLNNISQKIKQIQELLHMSATGVWDELTNSVFLNWLRNSAWSQYVVNNKFIGNLNTAIDILATEKSNVMPEVNAAPLKVGQPEQLSSRQAIRIENLYKWAIEKYEAVLVPQTLVEKWHRNPPWPIGPRHDGEDKYLVYNKHYFKEIGPDSIMVVMIYANSEEEAINKARKENTGLFGKRELAASKETPEQAAFLEARREHTKKEYARIDERLKNEREEESRVLLRDKAQRELHYAEQKGRHNKSYYYHMKEFARYMRDASTDPAEIQKYEELEKEYGANLASLPKLSREEEWEQIKQLQNDLLRFDEIPVPGFGNKSFKRVMNTLRYRHMIRRSKLSKFKNV